MKRLLVLGSNDNIALVLVVCRARERGVYTIVTDWNDVQKSPAKQVSDDYWMISTSDVYALEQKCREEKIDGIFGSTDYTVDIALELSERLGLPFYCDRDTWKYSRDKSAFKEQCRKYGVPTAKQYFLSDDPTEEELHSVRFPVIVKPVDGSGNQGFSYCDTVQELKEAINYAAGLSQKGKVVVEQRLCGRDHTALYAMADGEIRLLNFFVSVSQPGTPDNVYTINTSVTDGLHRYLTENDPAIRKMLKELGYRDGVVWIEFMPDGDGVFNAIEVGHRLCGEMLWLPLSVIRKFDCLNWMLDYTVNGKNSVRKLPSDQKEKLNQCACSYLMWTGRAGTVEKISGVDGLNSISDLHCSIVAAQGKTAEAYRYGAIITFPAETVEKMIETIQLLNKKIKIENEQGEDMLIRYDDFNALRELAKATD